MLPANNSADQAIDRRGSRWNKSRLITDGLDDARCLRRVIRCEPEDDARYRYALEVALREGEGPRLAAVLKNPSRASVWRSDPTIGKLEAWARRHGFARVVCVNLFAYRSTTPAGLNGHPYAVIVGPENDTAIRAAVEGADLVAVGWGNPNGIAPEVYDRRVAEVLALLRSSRPHQVGLPTRAGYPRHALLWNGGCEAVRLAKSVSV